MSSLDRPPSGGSPAFRPACYDAPMMHRGLFPANPRLARNAAWLALCGAVLLPLACAPGPALRGSGAPPLRVLVAAASTPLLPGLAGDVERDLARGIAAGLGREALFVPCTAGDPLEPLQAGGVDLVATGFEAAGDAPDGVVYSLPYRHEDAPVVLALKADDPVLRRRVNEMIVSRAFAAGDRVHRDDLEGIRKRGSLRLLALPHVGSFFLQDGAPRGFEYELLHRFAEEQGLALEIVSPRTPEELTEWLLAGRGDVLAANPEAPLAANARIASTRAVARVEMVVAARDDDPRPVREMGDLAGRTLVARRGGAEAALATQLADAVEGLTLEWADGAIGSTALIAGVGEGRYDLALVPSHLVTVERHAGRRVDAALRLENADLVWSVRASSPKLRTALDAYLARAYRGAEYNVLWRKYFRNGQAVARAVQRPGRLSPWDGEVRHWAAVHDLDWRLVVALMHQESRFQPEVVSPSGAAGLMQIVPETATELDLVDLHDPEESIRAGTRYLRWLLELYDEDLSLVTRLRFALASYNAGPGHVADARKLAATIGLDPDRWYDHVERAMLLLEQPEYYANARCGYCRGSETVRYVREIDRRYRLYVQFVPQDAPESSPDSGALAALPAAPAAPLPPA